MNTTETEKAKIPVDWSVDSEGKDGDWYVNHKGKTLKFHDEMILSR